MLNILIFCCCLFLTTEAFAQNAVDSSDQNSWLIESLELSNMPLQNVFDLLASETGLSIIADGEVQGSVTLFLQDVDVFDALYVILNMHGLAFHVVESENNSDVVQVMTAEGFEKKFGYSFGQSMQTEVVTLNYTTPQRVLRFLSAMRSDEGKLYIDRRGKTIVIVEEPMVLASMKEVIDRLDVKVEQKIFNLGAHPSDDFLAQIESLLTPDLGEVRLNISGESLIVTDTFDKLVEVQSLVDDYLHSKKNIFFKAKLIQIVLSQEHQKGVDWSAVVSNYKSLNFSDLKSDGLARHLSLGTIDEGDDKLLIEALDTVGIVQNIYDDEFYLRHSQSKDLDVRSADLVLKSQKPEDVDLVMHKQGLTLAIEPKIRQDRSIQIGLTPKVQMVRERFWMNNFFTRARPKKFTEVEGIEVQFELGETLVVGGLFKNIVVESPKAWFPFLGDLPLLGFAFRNQEQQIKNAELVLFITPVLEENE